MKNLKFALILLAFAATASAGSIWNYTFTDQFCGQCAPVGFSISEPAPLDIAPGADLWIPGADLASCAAGSPAMYCFGADLSWLRPGVLQVSVSRQYTYPTDWNPADVGLFAIPSLSTEGTYTNLLRYSGSTETQTFSIIDPPAGEDAPEPSAAWLLLVGAFTLYAVRCGRSLEPVREFLRAEDHLKLSISYSLLSAHQRND